VNVPLDLDDIEPLLSDAETVFRRGGQETEGGLDVSDAGFVQLRKACRSLSGGDRLLKDGFYTLGIEAAFTSIEKTFLFWLIAEGHQDPASPPQSHTTAIKRGAAVGLISTDTADRLEELWTENRAQTYYQDAKATRERAEAMVALANRIHTLVVNLVGVRHECVCG
jgi:HEPN domain-containing protein